MRRYTLKRSTRRSKKPSIIGINYEAGKTIQHVRFKDACLGYANIQIAMDAPYQGRVANESVRKQKRSELQFEGYNEPKLKRQLAKIFGLIKAEFPGVKVVIQIARGRAAKSTYEDVIQPVLTEVGIIDAEIISGYRRKNYWTPSGAEKFVYVNFGMYAVLTNNNAVGVGEICNPVMTRNVLGYSEDKGFILSPIEFKFSDKKNLLLRLPEIKPIYLFGIADDMPFITKDEYSEGAVDELLKRV
jgi:hypothetical protein